MSTRIQNSIIGKNLSNNTSSYSFTSFSEGKPGSLGDRQWEMEFGSDFQVVSRLGDFHILRQVDFSSSVCSLMIKLKNSNKITCGLYPELNEFFLPPSSSLNT